MKKNVLILFFVSAMFVGLTLQAGSSDSKTVATIRWLDSGIFERLQEAFSLFTYQKIYALVMAQVIPTLQYGPFCSTVLTSINENVSDSKEAVSLLINTILLNRIVCLYPYVHDHFDLIADHLVLGKGRFKYCSYDAIESILRYNIVEFYPYVAPWAQGIEQHAKSWQKPYFKRLFICRVIEWEIEEFYGLLASEFYSLLSEKEKMLIGLLSESDAH